MGFHHLRSLAIIILTICDTHLTSTFLLNDSVAQRREKRVKREGEIRDTVQAQGRAPMKLRRHVQANKRELSTDGDRGPAGTWTHVGGHGLASKEVAW